MSEERNSTLEEIKVGANQLVEKVREIINDGSANRITIKKGDHVYMEIPLTIGIGGAMAAIFLAPTLAAVAAVATLVSDVELLVEKDDDLPAIEAEFSEEGSDESE